MPVAVAKEDGLLTGLPCFHACSVAKKKEYTQTLIHSRHERVVEVMMVILKEVVHISPFVFVYVGFRIVSGEPRLVRPAERARHTRHEKVL